MNALTIKSFDAMYRFSQAASAAGELVPRHIKSPEHALVIIQAGAELGLPPMASLRGVQLIQGKVTLSADTQLALMIKHGARIQWLESTPTVAKLQLTREGQEPYVSVFTIEDAKRAGLAGGTNWKKYPQAMLRARAISAAARAYMPDVLAGCYLPGELGECTEGSEYEGTVVETVTEAPVAPVVEPIMEVVKPTAGDLCEALMERVMPFRRDLQQPGDMGDVCQEDAISGFFGGDPYIFSSEKIENTMARLRQLSLEDTMERLNRVMGPDIEPDTATGEGDSQ